MNDTVVVYDRIRENLGKHRGMTLRADHQPRASPRCSAARSSRARRCVMSLLAFFIWGTGVIKDFAFALVVGIVLGTYSTIYVARRSPSGSTATSSRKAGTGRVADAGERPTPRLRSRADGGRGVASVETLTALDGR